MSAHYSFQPPSPVIVASKYQATAQPRLELISGHLDHHNSQSAHTQPDNITAKMAAPVMYKIPAEKAAKAYIPPMWPSFSNPSVFLAGSIEMGVAIDWQSELTQKLEDMPVTILNPRRDDWDGSWEQDISNKQFKEQVDWEMDHLRKADVIALYFQPDTKSPISLLELGMHAQDSCSDGSGRKLVVCCPKGFWRRGNVQIVCARYGIKLVETREELVEEVKAKLTRVLETRFSST